VGTCSTRVVGSWHFIRALHERFNDERGVKTIGSVAD
jgi:hypothetical protein